MMSWSIPVVISTRCFLANGCALFEDEQTAKKDENSIIIIVCIAMENLVAKEKDLIGTALSNMDFPPPKDLSESSMGESISDEDIFNAISRDMKDTSDPSSRRRRRLLWCRNDADLQVHPFRGKRFGRSFALFELFTEENFDI